VDVMIAHNGVTNPVGRWIGLVPCRVTERLWSEDHERALVTLETDAPATRITLYLMGAPEIMALTPGVRVGMHLEVYE